MKIVSINKKIKGGSPCVIGTRITVKSILYLYKKKEISPSIIASNYYPQLNENQVDKVIKWYEKAGRENGSMAL